MSLSNWQIEYPLEYPLEYLLEYPLAMQRAGGVDVSVQR